MTISKALRFEVLRRDGFACTYCGRKPPDVVLHIDHVIPDALGGQDTPENLRTACVDCNAGKGSTPPDAALVAQVADDAARWAAAMKQASAEAAEKVTADDLSWFYDEWNRWNYGYQSKPIPLPVDWRNSVRRWLDGGLTQELILSMVEVAMGNAKVPPHATFTYFAGCCWTAIRKMQDRAAELIQGDGTP